MGQRSSLSPCGKGLSVLYSQPSLVPRLPPCFYISRQIKARGKPGNEATVNLQYRSSFQSSNLIGRTVTRSQTSLGVKARLGFRAGYVVFRMYGVLISTNQIRALI